MSGNKKTHYDILGVNTDSTQQEIKTSYRKLSLKYHPDKNDGKDEVFKELSMAYEILSDPHRRSQYDMSIANPSVRGGGGGGGGGFPHGFAHGFPPGFPPGFPAGLFTNNRANSSGGDMFENMFSMGGNGAQGVRIFRNGVEVNQRERPPEDISVTITISMKHSYEGHSVPVEIKRIIIRRGEKTVESETIYIDIPKGIGNNEIMLVKDGGNIIDNMNSNIRIKVLVEPNSLFKREGLNLIYDREITLKDALCGFSFDLPFINGNTYRINNNAGNIIVPGYLREIPDMGFVRGTNKGVLIIRFSILFPRTLSADVIKKFEELL